MRWLATGFVYSKITLVNTHFCVKKVSTILGYFDVAECENNIDFSELALVFEIIYIFVSKKVLKIRKFLYWYSLYATTLMRLYLSFQACLCIILSFLMRYRERELPLSQKAFYMQIMFNVKIKQKLKKLGDINTKQQIFVMQRQVTSQYKHHF